MSKPAFLALDEVLGIPVDQTRVYRGASGLRDLALLRSALAMPETTFDGEYLHPSAFEITAAYVFHLVRNHPFVDGNKLPRVRVPRLERRATASRSGRLVLVGRSMESPGRGRKGGGFGLLQAKLHAR